MTWYPDLSTGCMAGYGDDARAVGWLSGDEPYPVGDTPPAFVTLLESHVSAAWQPFQCGGFHTCDLDRCPATVGPPAPVVNEATLDAVRKRIARERRRLRRPWWLRPFRIPRDIHFRRRPGERSRRPGRDPRAEWWNLYVPTPERVYVAPAMILHYVADHQYRPPDEFVLALEACPPQGSPEYLALIDPFLSVVPLMFDRAGTAKLEADQRRLNQWVRRGMCPRCEFWQYLCEGDVAEHCGVPLVRLEERDPEELRRAFAT
jgi:hypothetical protein